MHNYLFSEFHIHFRNSMPEIEAVCFYRLIVQWQFIYISVLILDKVDTIDEMLYNNLTKCYTNNSFFYGPESWEFMMIDDYSRACIEIGFNPKKVSKFRF